MEMRFLKLQPIQISAQLLCNITLATRFFFHHTSTPQRRSNSKPSVHGEVKHGCHSFSRNKLNNNDQTNKMPNSDISSLYIWKTRTGLRLLRGLAYAAYESTRFSRLDNHNNNNNPYPFDLLIPTYHTTTLVNP